MKLRRESKEDLRRQRDLAGDLANINLDSANVAWAEVDRSIKYAEELQKRINTLEWICDRLVTLVDPEKASQEEVLAILREEI